MEEQMPVDIERLRKKEKRGRNIYLTEEMWAELEKMKEAIGAKSVNALIEEACGLLLGNLRDQLGQK